MGGPHEPVIDLWQTVAPVLADNLYLVLGTSDAAGRPWVSPVFFGVRDESLLYWVSSPDSRHSRNIHEQPTVAITVFDSRAAIGVGEAVYMTGFATALGASAGAVGLDTLNARLPVGRRLSSDDLGPRGPLGVYATPDSTTMSTPRTEPRPAPGRVRDGKLAREVSLSVSTSARSVLVTQVAV